MRLKCALLHSDHQNKILRPGCLPKNVWEERCDTFLDHLGMLNVVPVPQNSNSAVSLIERSMSALDYHMI